MSFFNPNTKIYSQVFYRFFCSFPNIIVFSTYFSILYDFLEFKKEMKKNQKPLTGMGRAFGPRMGTVCLAQRPFWPDWPAPTDVAVSTRGGAAASGSPVMGPR
jgi:hypothetical protein